MVGREFGCKASWEGVQPEPMCVYKVEGHTLAPLLRRHCLSYVKLHIHTYHCHDEIKSKKKVHNLLRSQSSCAVDRVNLLRQTSLQIAERSFDS